MTQRHPSQPRRVEAIDGLYEIHTLASANGETKMAIGLFDGAAQCQLFRTMMEPASRLSRRAA